LAKPSSAANIHTAHVPRLRSIFLLLACACCLSSCSFHSATNESGRVVMRHSNSIVRYHGERAFEKIKSKRKISHDPKYTRPVNRVAERLKKVIDMPNADWEFVVFKDGSPNAFALPGGKVGINSGIFKVVENDAMLAAVLGHEISHVTAGHAQKRMIHAIATVIAGAIIYQAMDHNEMDHTAEALTAYALASFLLDALPLSRRQEFESDRIGVRYMIQAGYDPRASIDLWKNLRKYHLRHGPPPPEFLRTHPHDDARIKALEAYMPEAMRLYREQQARH
ncbi:MAG: M48 family metallopeptidase, partial [Verrucomicrobiales bacterium]